MSPISSFAERHRLRAKRDVDGTEIIPGKLGHIYEHSDDKLGLMFMPPGEPRARLWSSVKARGIAVGMVMRQDADSEGTLIFDGSIREQAAAAIRLIKARPKRELTDTQRRELAERLRKARSEALKEGVSAARNDELGAA